MFFFFTNKKKKVLEKEHLEKGPLGFGEIYNKIIKYLNNLALNYLNKDNLEKSLIILYKCKILTEPSKFSLNSPLRALLLNNFSCYYRR